MDILIIGAEENGKECRAKFCEGHSYRCVDKLGSSENIREAIVFDFQPKDTSQYDGKNLVLFLNSSTSTLTRLISGKQIDSTVFGFCGLPTFLNREILEVTVLKEESKAELEKICGELDTKYKIVEDRVGMVTPRIISMIINEAYFAIEGEVASKQDIDLAMKLGTNYPFGPFEWCERIGIENVSGLLNAVYEETKDERYKICARLEREVNLIHAKAQRR